MGTVTEERVRSADGTRIAWTRTGRGPLLVVVDGAGCWSGFNSQRPLAGLLAADATVVTYDRRGRGSSTDTPPYAVAREIEDLAAVIAAVGTGAAVYGVSSGALLAMHAAAAGAPVTRLALFEPPIADCPGPSRVTAELAALVAAGRRREAALHFMASIGVPAAVVDALGPAVSALESVAPTLVHDRVLCDVTPVEVARRVTVPTLVLDAGGTGGLTGWATAVAAALPRGEHRSLSEREHAVPDAELAGVLRGFVHGR
ncbi:alpha/beta fold hydrolase [Modestobacter sp. URMC 112]